MTRPTLFLLHALGASGHEWREVQAALGAEFDCVPLDLPGFGDNAGSDRTDVGAMLDWLGDEIRRRNPAAYMLVGHSMGGKLATLVAARAQAGEQGLSALAGVVLLAGSPPSPEPMDEERRAEMLGWFADGPLSHEQAEAFIDANTAAPLTGALRDRAVSDVLRCNRHAWMGWLERGSREDWSGDLSRLVTPALIVAGAEDGDLGEAAQRRLNAPLYATARVQILADAAHLLPYEQSDRVAALIADHWDDVRRRALPATWARLLASDRVTARTRAAMIARIDDPADDKPSCLDPTQRRTLAALVARILPGCGSAESLARRLDADLAAGGGDGWRFADLPDDVTAWQAGLDTLDALADGFAGLDAERQDVLLEGVAAGEASHEGAALGASQLKRWFEEVRAQAARLWLSLPATMARIGYDGFANGGDGRRPQGFTRTRADDREPWQPAPSGATR